jgi:hypothetical protein
MVQRDEPEPKKQKAHDSTETSASSVEPLAEAAKMQTASVGDAKNTLRESQLRSFMNRQNDFGQNNSIRLNTSFDFNADAPNQNLL